MKKLTRKQLKAMDPCTDGFRWWGEHCEGLTTIEQIKRLMADDCPDSDWANWLIVRVMKRKQYLAYAIFAAEQVIEIYEKQYTNDARPRNAIEAAKKVFKRDTKSASDAAWAAARAAGDAAIDASDAAWAASDAAWAASDAAGAAGAAAGAAASDAAGAAGAAAGAAASDAMKRKILEYGISLLEADR